MRPRTETHAVYESLLVYIIRQSCAPGMGPTGDAMLQIPLSLWSIKVVSFPSFFAGKRAKSSERIGRVRPKFFGSTTLCEDCVEILDESVVLIRLRLVAPAFLPRAEFFERVDVERPTSMAAAALFEEFDEILDVLPVEGAIERIVAEGGDQAIRFPPIQIR